MNTQFRKVLQMALIVSAAVLLLAGVAVAQDEPDTLPATGAPLNSANSYVTQLDELRAMSLAGTSHKPATAALYSVYEYSSDLQRLNAMAAKSAAEAAVPTANDYSTRLDELRNLAAD